MLAMMFTMGSFGGAMTRTRTDGRGAVQSIVCCSARLWQAKRDLLLVIIYTHGGKLGARQVLAVDILSKFEVELQCTGHILHL